MLNKKVKQYLNELFAKVPCDKFPKDKARKDMEILRTAIIAEYDAVNLYEQLAEVANNPDIKKILLDVANEEKVHIGEFEALLEYFDKEHEPNEEEGEEEVIDELGDKYDDDK
jgi:rubrerythrin